MGKKSKRSLLVVHLTETIETTGLFSAPSLRPARPSESSVFFLIIISHTEKYHSDASEMYSTIYTTFSV